MSDMGKVEIVSRFGWNVTGQAEDNPHTKHATKLATHPKSVGPKLD